MSMTEEHKEFALINPATGKEIDLALQELQLSGTILPVGARLLVRHVFKSAEPGPIEVVYSFGLPRDAALRQFRIVGEGFSAVSELKPTGQAVKSYEEGIARGHLSTMARQYGDGIINLSVGNIRPGEVVAVYLEILAGSELRDDGFRFRFPFTLAPSYHAKARTVESAPGQGEMELPGEFGDVMLPKWMADAEDLHRIGFDLKVALPHAATEIGSPSHSIRVANGEAGHHRVSLAPEKDAPNRDLILDVKTRYTQPAVLGGIGPDGKGHFAVLAPSHLFGKAEKEPRRVVFLIDRSGSMNGAPIGQARRAVEACLGTLTEADTFGLVAFDDQVETMADQLVKGDAAGRNRASTFLKLVDARGGTELADGFNAAAGILGDEGGDVVIFTDGQAFETETILRQARSAGVRLHSLGIGSASQDRFLSLLARETGGLCRFVSPRERVDISAMELFASISSPVASNLKVESPATGTLSITPEPPSRVRSGEPVVFFGELESSVSETIRINWEADSGPKHMEIPLELVESGDAESVFLLQGSRLITDADSRMIPVQGNRAEREREATRQTNLLKRLSETYGLASRAMSLVAVVKRKGDKANVIPRTMIVPVGMPQDVDFEAYFSGHGPSGRIKPLRMVNPQFPSYEKPQNIFARRDGTAPDMDEDMELISCSSLGLEDIEAEEADKQNDLMILLAGRMEPDGGMPGKDKMERWMASMAALLFYLSNGNTRTSGTFRLQVQRLLDYLEQRKGDGADPRMLDLLKFVQEGHVPPISCQDQVARICFGQAIDRNMLRDHFDWIAPM